MRVGFQGELGAFSDEAITRAWGTQATPIPFRDNRQVVEAVAIGDVDRGLLPFENTLAGSVVASYDAMTSTGGVFAVGQVVLPVHLCVLAPVRAALSDLRTVESHPVALAQCSGFIGRHRHLTAKPAYDTAGAAREVAMAGDVSRGAIASRVAASRYGLGILAENIEDRSDNQTRFVAIGRAPAVLQRGVSARTIVVFSTPNMPGAVYRALEPFARHGINMVKLESRPTGEPWTYRFILEFVYEAQHRAIGAALKALQKRVMDLRVLGTFAENEQDLSIATGGDPPG